MTGTHAIAVPILGAGELVMDNVWRRTQGVESLGNQLLLHLRDLTRIALPNEPLDMRTDLFGCISRVDILDNEFQRA